MFFLMIFSLLLTQTVYPGTAAMDELGDERQESAAKRQRTSSGKIDRPQAKAVSESTKRPDDGRFMAEIREKLRVKVVALRPELEKVDGRLLNAATVLQTEIDRIKTTDMETAIKLASLKVSLANIRHSAGLMLRECRAYPAPGVKDDSNKPGSLLNVSLAVIGSGSLKDQLHRVDTVLKSIGFVDPDLSGIVAKITEITKDIVNLVL